MSVAFNFQNGVALGYVRSDTLPENTRYKDDGCDASLTCLECPLSLCKYPIVSLSELNERSLFHERVSWPKMSTYKRSVFLGN